MRFTKLRPFSPLFFSPAVPYADEAAPLVPTAHLRLDMRWKTNYGLMRRWVVGLHGRVKV
jgi:hypothetical protein